MEDNAKERFARRFVPNFLLKQRSIGLRLGPEAGRIYASLWLFDVLGLRSANQPLVPPSARSFVFVCFGNIMRSAMAEFLMRRVKRSGTGAASPHRVRGPARQRGPRSASLGSAGI